MSYRFCVVLHTLFLRGSVLGRTNFSVGFYTLLYFASRRRVAPVPFRFGCSAFAFVVLF
jgi:hypothetical protein